MGVYSIYDYIIYFLILIIVVDFIKRFLFSYIKFDRKFLIIISVYIFLGISIRLLADVGFFEKNQLWSITPGVYILCVVVGLVGVAIGLIIRRYTGIDYWISPFLVGLCGFIYTFYNLFQYITLPLRILYPLLLAIFITSSIMVLRIYPFTKYDNILIVFAHMLDASSTFIAHDFYGFGEEHLLPIFLIDLFGGSAVIMIPIKLILILIVILAIERYYSDEMDDVSYKILKVLIFILGIGPGIRNTVLPSLKIISN